MISHPITTDEMPTVTDDAGAGRSGWPMGEKAVADTAPTSAAPSYASRMLKRIEEVSKRLWETNEHLLTTGFWQLDKAFGGGLRPGIYLLPGHTNMGKTALMTNMALRIAQLNENAVVMYVALDENEDKVIPRLVSALAEIPIWAVELPREHCTTPGLMVRRQQGFEKLSRLASEGRLSLYTVTDGDGSVEWLSEEVKACIAESGGMQVCVFVDFLNDLTTRMPIDDKQERLSAIVHQLIALSRPYRVPIFLTAELRKTNRRGRATLEDIRETVRIPYKCDAVLMLHSEVSVAGQHASLYWKKPGSDVKLPVIEAYIAKSRFGSKQHCFFEFLPEQSRIIEPTEQAVQQYIQALISS